MELGWIQELFSSSKPLAPWLMKSCNYVVLIIIEELRGINGLKKLSFFLIVCTPDRWQINQSAKSKDAPTGCRKKLSFCIYNLEKTVERKYRAVLWY